MNYTSPERTRELLISHYQTYPLLQLQDLFKFLYQSAFGCEHMITAPKTVIHYISEEYTAIDHSLLPALEALDGNYYRVPLTCLNQGLQAQTLGRLFFLSARKEPEALSHLVQKLTVAAELIQEKRLPFSEKEFTDAVNEWAIQGYPALHHSAVFRESYKPAYRVIDAEYVPFLPLLTELDRRLAAGPVNLAIEGGSASGKSTLGKLLETLYDCTVFHMDDFFLRPEQRTPERFAEAGGNVDRERFLEEVLLPLSKNEAVQYRRFDCSTMQIEPPIRIDPTKLTVTEGAYSMHPTLSPYYNCSVFLDISSELQKERILRRNGSAMAARFFNEWIPLEQKYFSEMKIKEHCDMTIVIS